MVKRISVSDLAGINHIDYNENKVRVMDYRDIKIMDSKNRDSNGKFINGNIPWNKNKTAEDDKRIGWQGNNKKEFPTEGIKYIGSKRKIIPHIIKIINRHKDIDSVLDLFTGTTRVAQALKMDGYKVGSNDLAHYSEAFGKCYIEFNSEGLTTIDTIKSDIKHLNSTAPINGFLTTNYSGGAISLERKNPIMFWKRKNTLKADGIREEINNISEINSLRYYILLTSLMLALDKVDNTVGVQQAFLKNKWAARADKDLKLIMPKFIIKKKGEVYQEDANKLARLKSKDYDAVYIDPPYTSHSYASYYHIWDTIVLNDKPEVSGIINRRKNIQKSDYNSKSLIEKTFADLLKNIKSKYIFISYNNEGLLPYRNLIELCKEFGEAKIDKIDYRRNIMSQIGIYDKNGRKVGMPGEKRNIEYIITIRR